MALQSDEFLMHIGVFHKRRRLLKLRCRGGSGSEQLMQTRPQMPLLFFQGLRQSSLNGAHLAFNGCKLLTQIRGELGSFPYPRPGQLLDGRLNDRTKRSPHIFRRQPLLDAWEAVRTARGLPHVEWNLIVKTRDEATYHSPLYLDMVEDAILILDRGRFFEGVLAGMRERMRELGSRRIHLPDGSWYWDLKPDFRWGDVVEI